MKPYYLVIGFSLSWYSQFDGINFFTEAGGTTGECLPIGDEFGEYHCISKPTEEIIPCHDEHSNCVQWAQNGECRKNPKYMSYNCREACNSCVSLHHGSTQLCPDKQNLSRIVQLLAETQQYIYDKTSVNPSLFHSCINKDSMCATYALRGECKKNPGWMNPNCPALCKVCR